MKVLKSNETVSEIFMPPPQFGIAILLPTGQTMPDDVYLEFAINRIDDVPVADADLNWKRRHPTPFTDDAGTGQSGNMLKLFDRTTYTSYRMVTGTAGIEAVVVSVY